MRHTNTITAAVLLGGLILMGQGMAQADFSSSRLRDASFEANRRDTIMQFSRKAEARGDIREAEFYRDLAIGSAR